jgi:hypothetical protein
MVADGILVAAMDTIITIGASCDVLWLQRIGAPDNGSVAKATSFDTNCCDLRSCCPSLIRTLPMFYKTMSPRGVFCSEANVPGIACIPPANSTMSHQKELRCTSLGVTNNRTTELQAGL